MDVNRTFDAHNQIVIDCFFKLWRHSADSMFIMKVEDDGEFTLFENNPKSKVMMGLEENAIIDRLNIRATWSDDIVEKLYSSYRQAIEAREPVSVTQFATYEGKDVYVDTLLVPMFDADGAPTFVCGVSRDISKIKEAEQMAINASEKLKEYSFALEQMNQNLDQKVQERTVELEDAKDSIEKALEAKSSFVARMSHEIRTPINAVIGLSDLTLKTSLSDYQQDNLQKILDSGNLLLRLVDDILDFSKMEAGKLSVESVPFSLKSIIQHALDMNAIKASEKGIHLTTSLSASLPEDLIGDPLRIQQVLVNLISNAVKFTEEGGVEIRFFGEEKDDGKLWLRCEVEDSGMGMSTEQMAVLFQSFQQADDSITRKFGGTGLGLTISRQLCELMKGHIWVESKLGQGTKFIFTLPVERSLQTTEQGTTTLSGKVEAEPVPDFSGYRILLVDDNPINVKVALGYLEEVGAKIDVAINGEEAVSLVILNDYDLVLMDIQMPIMDGYTATSIIRQDLHESELPIVAMTAHVYDDAKEKALQAGMNDHIGKPIVKKKLCAVLKSYLSASQVKKAEKVRVNNQAADSNGNHVLVGLDRVDGIEVGRALRNVSGNYDLYLDILMTFYKNYQNTDQIKRDLDSGNDIEEIIRTLHTLKSSAAYIGAFTLSILCSTLEIEYLKGEKDNVKLNAMFSQLKKLISNLEYIFNNISKVDSIELSSTELTNQMLYDALAKSLPLLEKSDFSAETLLKALNKKTVAKGYAADIKIILDDVEDVEYEKAADKVRQLLTKLQGTL